MCPGCPVLHPRNVSSRDRGDDCGQGIEFKTISGSGQPSPAQPSPAWPRALGHSGNDFYKWDHFTVSVVSHGLGWTEAETIQQLQQLGILFGAEVSWPGSHAVFSAVVRRILTSGQCSARIRETPGTRRRRGAKTTMATEAAGKIFG